MEFGSPSPFANLPFSFEPFPSRLNTSWFVGTADGINTAEVVMKVGGYDGGFEARVGCSFFRRTSLLSALGPNGPGQMGRPLPPLAILPYRPCVAAGADNANEADSNRCRPR